MPDEDLVQEEAIDWATNSLHITTAVCPSMSALTHKVDPDEPVSNLIAVVHRKLAALYTGPNNNIVLILHTKIIDEPELSVESSTSDVLEGCPPPQRQ